MKSLHAMLRRRRLKWEIGSFDHGYLYRRDIKERKRASASDVLVSLTCPPPSPPRSTVPLRIILTISLSLSLSLQGGSCGL